MLAWDRFEKAATVLLGVVIIAALAFQFQSLYFFPQYDGARWWGDEFGQIIELKSELERGYAHIPTGKGATVEITNGIVRGNSWFAALVYGLPAVLFYPSFDLVSIGRTVTAFLSLSLLVLLYFSLRQFKVTTLLALIAVGFVALNRSFFFASHSARLDIAAGLAVLGWVYYVCHRLRQPSHSALWYFVFGAATFFLATFSIHLLTLLGPVAAYSLFLLGKNERAKAFGLSISGVLTTSAALFAAYLLTGAPVVLFGETAHHIQSYDVLSAMPAFQPLSWSVQSSNVLQRVEQFWIEAPIVLPVVLVSTTVTTISWKSLDPQQRVISTATLMVLISWLLFQSSADYYLLHITPLLILQSFVVLRGVLNTRTASIAMTVASMILAAISFTDVSRATHSARVIHRQNGEAIRSILGSLKDDPLRVLAQYPAVPELHKRLGDRLVTTHFLNFPREIKSAIQVLREQRVGSLILYRTSRQSSYSFEVDTLWQVANTYGQLESRITGNLFDVGIDYFKGLTGEDTLYHFRISQ